MEKRIEELSLNAWPSLQTVVYDGWLLRFGGGYTRRANSISPLYGSEVAFKEKIAYCEKLYNSVGLNTVFKIAEKSCPEGLDKLLAEAGYNSDAHTSVQVLELNGYKEKELGSLIIRNRLEEDWLSNMQLISGSKSHSDIEMEAKILSNIVAEKYFVELLKDGEAVACGLGVLEAGCIGIYDIMVSKEHRGMGYGRNIMEGLLSLGKSKGLALAYLQVMLDNPVALKLYASLGFSEIYKYWYRVKKLQEKMGG